MSGHIQHRKGHRFLLAITTIGLYAVIVFILVGLTSESWWPSIGDDGFSAGQAAVVPALNVYAIGIILAFVCRPFASATARIVVIFLVAVLAAVAGPLLPALTGGGDMSGLLSPGVIALAVVGTVVAAACVGVGERRNRSRVAGAG